MAAADPASSQAVTGSLSASSPLHLQAIRQPPRSESLVTSATTTQGDLFPARRGAFDALMATLGYDPAEAAGDTSPAGVGNRAAAAVLAYRAGHGANQAGGYADTTGYQPVNIPNEVLDPDRFPDLRRGGRPGRPVPPLRRRPLRGRRSGRAPAGPPRRRQRLGQGQRLLRRHGRTLTSSARSPLLGPMGIDLLRCRRRVLHMQLCGGPDRT